MQASASGRVSKLARSAALALCLALLALLSISGSAQASTEHHFCWGIHLSGGGSGCSSGTWWMQAAYGGGTEAPVCIYSSGIGTACEKFANEGAYIYIPGGGSVQTTASVVALGKATKAYGVFWTP